MISVLNPSIRLLVRRSCSLYRCSSTDLTNECDKIYDRLKNRQYTGKIYSKTGLGESMLLREPNREVLLTDETTLYVFCDGSFGKKAGIGVHIPKMNGKFDLSLPVARNHDSTYVEIQAATYSLVQALKVIEIYPNKYKNVVVYSDNTKVVNLLNKLKNELITENSQLGELIKKFDRIEIEWKHVKSHSGCSYNEITDRLAKQASKQHLIENKELWNNVFSRVLYPNKKEEK